ncbi:hypothetical protein XELAEV_18022108mg [Xenopus laevis]|uniref:Uncharacterized protein n=1 Tax=Xenopus laevis TaxID=8355 RepID=A0A974D4H6_XENLA|nr:hypothetical protein XELAEV_18022108mg [Xenopus laevis]
MKRNRLAMFFFMPYISPGQKMLTDLPYFLQHTLHGDVSRFGYWGTKVLKRGQTGSNANLSGVQLQDEGGICNAAVAGVVKGCCISSQMPAYLSPFHYYHVL